MKILVLNAGSSSIKYQVFNIDMDKISVLTKDIIEIGKDRDAENFVVAVDKMKENIANLGEISAVGHRVVHGGEDFSEATLVTDEVLEKIDKHTELAPLHNPANMACIIACMVSLPGVPNVAVFDTAFHSKMPEKAYLYALPYELYKKRKIRRYGFHGTSHRYVSYRTAELLEKKVEDLKMITCHLGNGASIAAVDAGVSVDTSMGFTPLEGVIMGTRCGDIDPAIVFFLMEKEGMTPEEINKVLNKESGVFGVSGVSNDMRDLKKAADEGNKRAQIALDMYVYRIQKYIGSFTTVMGGVDAIIFTAGVGENNPYLRELVCDSLGYLGLHLDKEKNEAKINEKIISTKSSKVDILVVPTNEEILIAKDTYNLVNK